MKIVYLISAHHNPEQLGRLIDALDGARVYVHIDAKSNIKPFADVAAKFLNATIIDERVNTLWGGWSQVQTSLCLLYAAEPDIDADDYVVLLSGDSYPLQNQSTIHKFFASATGTQFINMVPMPAIRHNKPITRISRYYLEYDSRGGQRFISRRIINKLSLQRNWRQAFGGRKPYAGSQWWCLSGSAIAWILGHVRTSPQFVDFCKHTFIPDEFFFQTVLGNSPFAESCQNSVMYTDWNRPLGPKPALIDEFHIRELFDTGLFDQDCGYGHMTALFARKVGSENVCELIQSELWPRPFTGVLPPGDRGK